MITLNDIAGYNYILTDLLTIFFYHLSAFYYNKFHQETK